MVSQNQLIISKARIWKFNFIFINSRSFCSKFSHYNKTKMSSPIEYSAVKAGIINMTKYIAKFCKGKK